MGIRRAYIISLIVSMTSCNWFDPFDIPIVEDDFKSVSYFLPLDNDSSVCFLSRFIDVFDQTSSEAFDYCAKVHSSENEIVSCGNMSADTSSVWVETGGFSGIHPGDTIYLEIESTEFDVISSYTIAPESALINSYSMTSRSYYNGSKYFDELVLELLDPSVKSEAYMLQLISHVDTIGAPSPAIRSMKSDDPNMIRRSFGDKLLDNALFFDDSFWQGGSYTFHFRSRSMVDEGVPYHFTLLVHSISYDMYKFFYDLEASDMTGYFNGGSFAVHSNIDGGHGCFGAMNSTQVLLFP
ncbi:MAG: hypothetical protein CMB32_06640 [Euryarchaeota archaeon]|nr:hypothetical protein [Euryarchaeota archaeon]